jgi:hypothetical protein
MTKPTDAELLPCPFCGGPVALEEAGPTQDRIHGERRWWGVVCRNTMNRGGTCAIYQRPSASKEAAIERWNRRAPQAVAGGEPVGYINRGIAPHTAGKVVFHDKPTTNLEARWWSPDEVVYTAPPPQAVREPLPKFLALKFHARRDKKATVTLLFDGHETADAWVRGITKGGQHGAE